ncbi:MAG: addiction module protein [Verrucomicrobia bacterium]|nr:addiction module protein [Verrucomicrobiota bacterium]
MTAEAEKIALEVLTLPTAVRAFLAHRLIASLEDDFDDDAEAEWAAVIDRRSQEIEAGTVTCRPVAEVVKEIRAKLHVSRRQPS